MNPTNMDVTALTPEFFPGRGSKRAKVRYGPFTVAPMDQHAGMVDELLINVTMPCRDCTITHMQATMEYPNGEFVLLAAVSR